MVRSRGSPTPVNQPADGESLQFADRTEIHVWYADLDAFPQPDSNEIDCLSPDERERADRFRFNLHRRRWTASRLALRRILSSYVGLPPGELRFSLGRNGKPALDQDCGSHPLHFNLTRSDALTAVAVTRLAPVGIDVERLREIPDALRIAESYFAPEEFLELSQLPQSEQTAAFLRCWTRKEAFVKALGDGLSFPLDRFRVSLRRDEPARIGFIGGIKNREAHWRLHALTPPRDYLGALALPSSASGALREYTLDSFSEGFLKPDKRW